ncbi:hypothetical protein ACFVP0_25070 [Streptomyces cinereoruber]
MPALDPGRTAPVPVGLTERTVAPPLAPRPGGTVAPVSAITPDGPE